MRWRGLVGRGSRWSGRVGSASLSRSARGKERTRDGGSADCRLGRRLSSLLVRGVGGTEQCCSAGWGR